MNYIGNVVSEHSKVYPVYLDNNEIGDGVDIGVECHSKQNGEDPRKYHPK